MVDHTRIFELSERIVRRFAPERVILFGSHAYGAPEEGSDVDLLVIMPYVGHSARKAAEILRATGPRFAVDLIVRSPEEVRQRLAWNDFFLREVMEKGVVLYEATYA